MVQNGMSGTVAGAPVIASMQVIPVAGRDSMLLNLSGAHAPFFTRTSSSSPTIPATPASARCRAEKRSGGRWTMPATS